MICDKVKTYSILCCCHSLLVVLWDQYLRFTISFLLLKARATEDYPLKLTFFYFVFIVAKTADKKFLFNDALITVDAIIFQSVLMLHSAFHILTKKWKY